MQCFGWGFIMTPVCHTITELLIMASMRFSGDIFGVMDASGSTGDSVGKLVGKNFRCLKGGVWKNTWSCRHFSPKTSYSDLKKWSTMFSRCINRSLVDSGWRIHFKSCISHTYTSWFNDTKSWSAFWFPLAKFLDVETRNNTIKVAPYWTQNYIPEN